MLTLSTLSIQPRTILQVLSSLSTNSSGKKIKALRLSLEKQRKGEKAKQTFNLMPGELKK
jgi:hypothetical protein